MFDNIPNRFCAAHRTKISRIWTLLNVLQTYAIVICNCIDTFFFAFAASLMYLNTLIFNFDIVIHVWWLCFSIFDIIMFFNFGNVIHVGWSCFSMYCNWYEMKFVCFVLFCFVLSGSGASVLLWQRGVVNSVPAFGGRCLPDGPFLGQTFGAVFAFYSAPCWYRIPTDHIVVECIIMKLLY